MILFGSFVKFISVKIIVLCKHTNEIVSSSPEHSEDDGPPTERTEWTERTDSGLSTGGVVGIIISGLTLLVVLSVGGVIGCLVIIKHQQKRKGQGANAVIYEEPMAGPVTTDISLSQNQAYGHVELQENKKWSSQRPVYEEASTGPVMEYEIPISSNQD